MCDFNGIVVDYNMNFAETHSNFTYTHRSKIWRLPAKKIERDLISVLKAEDGTVLEFSKLGRDSLFGHGNDNCFTWARAKLSNVGIELGKSKFGCVVTATNSFVFPLNYYLKYPKESYNNDNKTL